MDNFTQPKYIKARSPAPSKPDFFDKSLTLMAGTNLYGDPLLKVGWSHDLRMFRNGNSEAIKYPGWACWVLEKYVPPSFFEPKWDWENRRYRRVDGKKIDMLGEFPNGRTSANYIMATPLANPDGTPVTLGSDVLLWIDINKDSLLHRVPSAYESLAAYSDLQDAMLKEEEKMWAEMENETADWDDYVSVHQDEINRNPQFTFPTGIVKPNSSLWTPDGEVSLDGATRYVDKSGAMHTLWEDKDGNGHAQIDFTA